MHRLQFTGTAPRNRVHPSIHPSIHSSIHLSIHYFTSFIQAPESNHNSPPTEQKETKPIFDRRPPFSPSFFRLQPSYLFVTRRYPLFSRIRQRNIVESEIQIPIIIRTNRLDRDISVQRSSDTDQPISTTISTNRSENRSFFFLLKYTKKHVPSRPRPILDILFKKQKCVL